MQREQGLTAVKEVKHERKFKKQLDQGLHGRFRREKNVKIGPSKEVLLVPWKVAVADRNIETEIKFWLRAILARQS